MTTCATSKPPGAKSGPSCAVRPRVGRARRCVRSTTSPGSTRLRRRVSWGAAAEFGFSVRPVDVRRCRRTGRSASPAAHLAPSRVPASCVAGRADGRTANEVSMTKSGTEVEGFPRRPDSISAAGAPAESQDTSGDSERVFDTPPIRNAAIGPGHAAAAAGEPRSRRRSDAAMAHRASELLPKPAPGTMLSLPCSSISKRSPGLSSHSSTNSSSVSSHSGGGWSSSGATGLADWRHARRRRGLGSRDHGRSNPGRDRPRALTAARFKAILRMPTA